MDVENPSAFFSYSRADEAFAIRLAEDLKSAGANVWMDQLDIEPGTPWDRAIESALTRSSRMLVILSPASTASDNVSDEVSYALSKQKRVIPILYQECDVPFRLARLQHIDFRIDYRHGLKTLTRVLCAEQPTPLQNKSATTGIVTDPETLLAARASVIPEEAEHAPPPAKQTPVDQIRPHAEEPEPLEKQPLRVPERIWQQQEEGSEKTWERREEAKNLSSTAGISVEEDHQSAHEIVSTIKRWGWTKVSAAICLVLLTIVVTVRWRSSHQGGQRSDSKQSEPPSPQRQAFPPKSDVPQDSVPPAGDQSQKHPAGVKPSFKAAVSSSGGMKVQAKPVAPAAADLPPGMDSTLVSAYQAAQAGDFYNMVLIGDAYRTGKGVAKDCKQAGFWYANATNAANPVQRSWMESDAVRQSWSECKADLVAELLTRLAKTRQKMNESVSKNLKQ